MAGIFFTSFGRMAATAGLALAALAVSSGAALAIDPFDNFACPGATLPVAGLTTVPTSTADNVTIAAGQRLTISVTGGVSGTIVRTDTNATIISLFAPTPVTTATLDGPLTVSLNTPDLGGGALFSAAPGSMTITFSCSAIGGGPQPPPVISNAATFVDSALLDQDDREPYRVRLGFSRLFNQVRRDCPAIIPPLTRQAFEDMADDYADDVARFRSGAFAPGSAESEAELKRLQCLFDVLDASYFYDDVDPDLPNPPGTRQSAADGNVFNPGSWRSGDWDWNAYLDGAAINRDVAGASRQTTIGSLSVLGTTPFGDNGAFGIGIKLGGATSTQGSLPATLNSMQYGLDFYLAKGLDNGLNIGGYAGYELGAHRADFAGATGDFLSHALKVGGELSGAYRWEEFSVEPYLSGLLQFRHRNGYLDSLGGTVPSSDAFVFDLTAGKTISRDFYFPESDMVVTPFAGGSVSLAAGTVTPALGAGAFPTDAFKVQVYAGVNAQWNSGVTASLQADYTWGETTSGFGVSASLKVPLGGGDAPRPADRVYYNYNYFDQAVPPPPPPP